MVLFGLTRPVLVSDQAFGDRIEHRFGGRDEVARLPAEVLKADSLVRLEQGDRCLLQTIDQRLAGAVWVSTAPVVELHPGVRLSLPSDAVYTFRTWTDPAFRGHGLQGRRHLAALAALRNEGRSRLLCFAEITSFGSLRGIRKSGCEPIGTVLMRRSGDPRPRLRISDQSWSDVAPAGP